MILVLCDTYDDNHKPTKTNHRVACNEAMKSIEICDPMWGIEQEFTLMGIDGQPFGWPVGTLPLPQEYYYCGVGANHVYGRCILECLYHACLYAGKILQNLPVPIPFEVLTYFFFRN